MRLLERTRSSKGGGDVKHIKRVLLTATLGLATIAGSQAVALADDDRRGSRGTIYSSIPKRLPGNVVSLGFEATSTREFGDHVRFTPGSKRRVREVTVVLSSWGCETGAWNTGDCRTSKRAKFRHPITLNLYGVSGSGLGPLLATTTEKFKIPYRPSASSKCGDGRWYSRKEKTCFNGFALEVSFKLRKGVTLPDEVIWGVAYSTTHHGYAPVGQGAACFTEPGGCGYDSLNVGSESLALVGTDVDPDGAYLNTTHAPFYCDGGAGGVGTFRNDTGPPVCWTGFRPMAKFEARGRGGDDD